MTIYVAAALLSGLAVLFLILGIYRLVRPGATVGERLETYSATATAPFDEFADEQSGMAGRLNEYLEERSFSGSVRAKIARAGVKLTVPEYVLIKAAAILLPLTVLMLLGQVLVGVLLGAICFLLPDMWLKRRERKRQQQFVLQLPDTLTMIVGGLRAGFSLQHSLLNVARQAPEPTASEFQRVGQEMQLGVALIPALDSLVRRIKSDDLEMIVSVFKIHSRVGGNLATVLETVGTTIRERVKLRREIVVMTSQARLSSYILGALPPALAAIIFVINRSYMMEIFHWNIFLCIPIFAFIMMVIGFLILRKMANIKV